MQATKRIFISDVHLGIGNEYEWYQPTSHEKNLLSLLDWVVSHKQEIKDLVLLGDLFDTWMCPVHKKPPSVQDILSHNPKVVQSLCEVLGAITNVFYVNGNHDMEATANDLANISSHGKIIRCIQRYNAGMLYGEHGSRFAMFNAPDRLHAPADGYPLGYFITRLVCGRPDYLKPGSLVTYIDDLLESAFSTQTIAESVIEALMELTETTPDTSIVMPGSRRPLLIREVQQKYSGLFDRWVEKFGYRYALHAIQGEMGSLGWFADRLSAQGGFKVVVLGHTHGPEIDSDSIVVSDRIYVNVGYCCTPHPTFVEVDKNDDRLTVRLYEIVEGIPEERAKRSVV